MKLQHGEGGEEKQQLAPFHSKKEDVGNCKRVCEYLPQILAESFRM